MRMTHWMRRTSLLVGAVSALAAGLLAQAPARRLALPDTHQFNANSFQSMVLSPDGGRIVYAANARLYVQATAGGPPTEIPGTAIPKGVMSPAFSPDGRTLVFWSGADETLQRIPVSGGTPVTICQADNPFGVSWGANDQIVFAQAQKGIMRVAAGGGTPETIVAVRSGEFPLGARMLPGTDTLLFTLVVPRQGAPGFERTEIVVQSLGSGARRTLIETASEARYVPTGHLVYWINGTLMAVPFDLKTLALTGPQVPVVGEIRQGFGGVTGQYSFSDSGALVYVQGRRGQNQVALVDRDGRRHAVGQLPDSAFAPRLSPDGARLAVDEGASIWVADMADLSSLRRIAAAGPATATGANQYPLWSGDGQRVIFTSTRGDGVQGLWWQRADGTGDAELLVKPARSAEYWSAPNQRLSYITLRGDLDYGISTFSLQDRTSTPLVDEPTSAQLSSRFSHDGKWFAYQSNESGRYEIYVQPFPATGEKVQVTRDGGMRPVWSADDRELFFDDGARLFSVPLQTQPAVRAGEATALPISGFVQLPANARRQWDMTADGKQFLLMFPGGLDVRVVPKWFADLKSRAR
jgi:Tol biopolymer transport system component